MSNKPRGQILKKCGVILTLLIGRLFKTVKNGKVLPIKRLVIHLIMFANDDIRIKAWRLINLCFLITKKTDRQTSDKLNVI